MTVLSVVVCFIFFISKVACKNYERAALVGVILHQSNPSCEDVDTSKEFIPCTISSTDYFSIQISAHSPHCLVPHCRDGSVNMTCIPLSPSPHNYYCVCNEAKQEMDTSISWNEEWNEITHPVAALQRSLCHQEAGWCVAAMFKLNSIYLVRQYVIDDTQITVSSFYDKNYPKGNVRISDIPDFCAWVALTNDSTPWVKFDMLESYTGVGVVIRQRCDGTEGKQYVTDFDISSSNDDVTWVYIGRNIRPVYKDTFATWWFPHDVEARFWKIEILEFYRHRAMQADIIGRIGS